jgi:hypothetical protein
MTKYFSLAFGCGSRFKKTTMTGQQRENILLHNRRTTTTMVPPLSYRVHVFSNSISSKQPLPRSFDSVRSLFDDTVCVRRLCVSPIRWIRVSVSVFENTTTRSQPNANGSVISLTPFWCGACSRESSSKDALLSTVVAWKYEMYFFVYGFLVRVLVGISDSQMIHESHCKVATVV